MNLTHISMQGQRNQVVHLTDDLLQKKAPSIFTMHGHERTSSRYVHIPSIKIVEMLRAEGWYPRSASESYVRAPSRSGFSKHMVVFRHRDHFASPTIVGDSVPEIVFINSHDGLSSYQLHAGIFRLVCLNGLIVSDTVAMQQSVRHFGDILDGVMQGVVLIAQRLPIITDNIKQMRMTPVNDADKVAFAESALLLGWDEGKAPIHAGQLLRTRRADDAANNVWTLFNVVQENMFKGDLFGRNSNGISTRTRPIKSISRNVQLNKSMWDLAHNLMLSKNT